MTEVKRKRYTREFKRDAVTLVACEKHTIAAAARRLGVNENMQGAGRARLKPMARRFSVALGRAPARPRICIDSGRRTGDLGSSATF